MAVISNGETGISVRTKLNTLFGEDLATMAWSGTIIPDISLPIIYDLTLTGNVTLGNPTGIRVGGAFGMFVNQGTGGNTMAFGAYYKFEDGTAPSLTTTSGARDLFLAYCYDNTGVYGGLITNIS